MISHFDFILIFRTLPFSPGIDGPSGSYLISALIEVHGTDPDAHSVIIHDRDVPGGIWVCTALVPRVSAAEIG